MREVVVPLRGLRRVLVPGVYHELGPRAEALEVAGDAPSHPLVMTWSADGFLALGAGRDCSFRIGSGAVTVRGADPQVEILRGRSPAHVLRTFYAACRDEPAAPWVSLEEAVRLAVHGVLDWHHRPATRTIAETVGFGPDGHPGEREAMHVAWLSGIPVAAAILPDAPDAAAVIDHCSEAIAPCGAFWGQWVPNEGWRHGWNRPGLLHSRTAAEATLFLGRIQARRRSWQAAVRSNLDWAEKALAADGTIPRLFDAKGGEGVEWDGTAGLLWAAAFAEAGRLTAARRIGARYADAVLSGDLRCSPEDVPAGATSEDAYNAVIAYVALFEATGEPDWLDLARAAADWTMAWRFPDNLPFPGGSALSTCGYRTRGADIASPANPHLHTYGLLALPEMLRLARLAGDDYLLKRTRDNLLCSMQTLARVDRELGARRGMQTERYYHTDALGPKGGILPLSHAWCLGLLAYACRAAMRYREELDLG
jgi:hypothetical protein